MEKDSLIWPFLTIFLGKNKMSRVQNFGKKGKYSISRTVTNYLTVLKQNFCKNLIYFKNKSLINIVFI